MHSQDIKELQFARFNPQFIPHLLQSTPLISHIHNQPTNMFTALRTLADTAAGKTKLSPLLSMSDLTSGSSDEEAPQSLLFKIDLEEEDQFTSEPIIQNISHLFDATSLSDQSLWDKNRTEALAQVTNQDYHWFNESEWTPQSDKDQVSSSPPSRPVVNSFLQQLLRDPEIWSTHKFHEFKPGACIHATHTHALEHSCFCKERYCTYHDSYNCR